MFRKTSIKVTAELCEGAAIDAAFRTAANNDIAIIDVRALKRIPVDFLGRLVHLRKNMLRGGRLGVVRLVVRSALVMKTLHVTGLNKVFEIYPTLDSADAARTGLVGKKIA